MVRLLNAAFYGLVGMAMAGVAGALIVGYADKSANLDNFGSRQVSAAVRKFEGSKILEEIVRGRQSEIEYATDDGLTRTKATIDVSKALESACGTERFAGAQICQEYGKIPAAVEAQAAKNKKYMWVRPAKWASVAILFGGAAGAAGILLYAGKRRGQRAAQTQNAVRL